MVKIENWTKIEKLDKNEKLDKMKIGILPQALFLRLSETLDWIRQNGQKQHLDEHAIEAKQSPWSDNGKYEPRREIKAEISSGSECRNL